MAAEQSQRRVPSVDVLRGVALFGILVMNAQSFAMPHVAYMNPKAYGSLDGLEGWAFSLSRLVFDFKFITLFSALFGASLVLAPADSKPRRRLFWLIVFGALHGYLIWFGDVLFTYGVVGLIVLGARDWPVRRLVTVGGVLMLISSVVALAGALAFDSFPEAMRDGVFKHYDPAEVPHELEVFRGPWLGQLPLRAAISFDNQTLSLIYETGWRAAGAMLVGMAAVKSKQFESGRFFPIGAVVLSAGAAVTGFALWHQWSSDFAFRTWLWAQALHEFGSLGMAAGFGLLVIDVANRFSSALVVQAIGRLGRLAFTAYVMHSLVGSFVFGGHGLSQFGHWSRVDLLVFAVALWSAQLVLAWWWTSKFRIGPLEALWRGLSRGDFSLHPISAQRT